MYELDLEFIEARLSELRLKQMNGQFRDKDTEEYERLVKVRQLLAGKPTDIVCNTEEFTDVDQEELNNILKFGNKNGSAANNPTS